MGRSTSYEEPLAGGVSNYGLVVRLGDTVHRPQTARSPAVHALLQHLERVGFDGAPRYLGQDDAGREVLSYVEGEAAAKDPHEPGRSPTRRCERRPAAAPLPRRRARLRPGGHDWPTDVPARVPRRPRQPQRRQPRQRRLPRRRGGRAHRLRPGQPRLGRVGRRAAPRGCGCPCAPTTRSPTSAGVSASTGCGCSSTPTASPRPTGAGSSTRRSRPTTGATRSCAPARSAVCPATSATGTSAAQHRAERLQRWLAEHAGDGPRPGASGPAPVEPSASSSSAVASAVWVTRLVTTPPRSAARTAGALADAVRHADHLGHRPQLLGADGDHALGDRGVHRGPVGGQQRAGGLRADAQVVQQSAVRRARRVVAPSTRRAPTARCRRPPW